MSGNFQVQQMQGLSHIQNFEVTHQTYLAASFLDSLRLLVGLVIISGIVIGPAQSEWAKVSGQGQVDGLCPRPQKFVVGLRSWGFTTPNTVQGVVPNRNPKLLCLGFKFLCPRYPGESRASP